MAKLLMADGTVRNVDYNKAAKVLQILQGMDEPENQEQADFVATVKNVDFNDGKTFAEHPEFERKPPKDPDPEFARIMADKSLSGLERARAVAKHIKERGQQ